MLYIKSLAEERREINRRKGLKGVAERLRRIAEAPAPPYPADRSDDYRIVHIEDRAGGRTTEHILMLTPAGDKGRCDQWHIWQDAKYQGVMGWERARGLLGPLYPAQRAVR